MSGKKELPAKPKDVERRFAARMWLTEAILRAQRDDLDVGPATDLLEALENLDRIEVVEDCGKPTERVVCERSDGPANIRVQDSQIMRLIGKTDPMLTMPEPSGAIVNGGAGGRTRTPSETLRVASACAMITCMEKLGMSQGNAVAYVEEELGPAASDLKKIRAGSASKALIDEYRNALIGMGNMSKDDLILLLFRMAGVRIK